MWLYCHGGECSFTVRLVNVAFAVRFVSVGFAVRLVNAALLSLCQVGELGLYSLRLVNVALLSDWRVWHYCQAGECSLLSGW